MHSCFVIAEQTDIAVSVLQEAAAPGAAPAAPLALAEHGQPKKRQRGAAAVAQAASAAPASKTQVFLVNACMAQIWPAAHIDANRLQITFWLCTGCGIGRWWTVRPDSGWL